MNLSIVGRAGARLAMTAFLLTPVLSMAQVKVAPGTIATIAGNQALGIGYTGDGAAATGAQLNLPFQAVFAGGNLYISDQVNNVIRYVKGSTGIITTIAGDNIAGFTKDGVAATTSELSSPTGIWVDGSGNLYIADTQNAAVRVVNTKGIISTVAGVESTPGYQGDGSGALSANLLKPAGVAFDSAGNMYIADSGNNVIRKVTPSTAANPDVISTYAGRYNGGVPGYLGDFGPATNALLNDPVAIALDASGNLYIADSNNDVVRKVATNGIITTIAGNGTSGFSGDGRVGTLAQLSHPKGIVVDPKGNVYISDTFNQRIRMVSPNGIISTVVGTGVLGYSGDGGVATTAQLNFPAGLSIDASGNIYIADNGNSVIRQYVPPSVTAGSLPVINSGGVISASSFGAFSAIAPGSWIEIYGSNLAAGIANWTLPNGVAPTSLNGTTVTIGGVNAVIDYVSPGQVNAQVPPGVSGGSQQLVVATAAGQSAAYSITINGTEAGLWAPPTYQVGGKQYVGALLSDGSWALPTGSVPNVTTRPANPGETIVMYGVGFGPVTPSSASPAGQIVTSLNFLTTPLAIFFGPAQATVSYYGLAPGYIGLYQFNVVVPNVAANPAEPLTFVLGSTNSLQTLYIAVQ